MSIPRGLKRFSLLGLILVAVIIASVLQVKNLSREDKNKRTIYDSSTKKSDGENVTSRRQLKTNKIKQISLIGERNSGTSWMTSHLQKCFGHSEQLTVQAKLVRNKHWFQHDVNEDARVHDTLVVAQFRNPYLWVEAMRKTPYHSPMHAKKDWYTFLTTPWTMTRTKKDLSLLEDLDTKVGVTTNTSAIQCQEGYLYNQINSCLHHPYEEGHKMVGPSGLVPQYELRQDGSGAAYPSMLEMRADKIRNHLEVANWDWVADFTAIQYEELLEKGTAFLIEHIEKVTGVTAECTPSPPQNRPVRDIAPDLVEWMNEFHDWDAEKLVGYEKMKPSDAVAST